MATFKQPSSGSSWFYRKENLGNVNHPKSLKNNEHRKRKLNLSKMIKVKICNYRQKNLKFEI